MSRKKDKKYFESKEAELIIQNEKEHLKLDPQQPVSGLAISGGGIRSASFGLGVMQALVANDKLKEIDYMSTVSGGGYIGSALTWALKQDEDWLTDKNKTDKHKKGKPRKYGRSPHDFPFGKVDGNLQENNKLLDFIRQHASYLTPTPGLDIVSFATVVMRSMAMSLFVYFSFLTIAMTSSLWFIYYFKNFFIDDITFDVAGYHFLIDKEKGLMLLVGFVILVFIFLKGFLYSLLTFFSGEKKLVTQKRYISFVTGQIQNGNLFKLSITCMVFGSLPFIIDWVDELTAYVASGSTLFGALVGLWQYKKAQQNQKSSGMSSDILIYSGAIALFYGVLLLAYLGTYFFLTSNHDWEHPILFIILIALCFIFGIFVNLNLIGPHHIWRNRLMEAFMPNGNAVRDNQWNKATEADSAQIEDMCDDQNPKPYHIINTNVILGNSPTVDFSSRGGDNFILSPLFCGSDATGWINTKDYHKEKNQGLTLATAMATSAAALNPNAGVSGEGVTRNVVVSLLLSFLNLRLGFWTRNPKRYDTFLMTPNFIVPGLTSEIFRTGLTETNRFIQLSDGGHFENLGIYELIRRKLDLIIVSDGGADPAFNFDDLANAIEKVRVDFGTKIKFIDDYKLDNIIQRPIKEDTYEKKYEIAKKGFAIADIFYNDRPDKPGKLIYLKLAMIEGMSADVYSYKGVHPAFPHESTADQFFDEKQFEAYRELGYSIGWQMLVSEEGTKIFNLAKKVENKIVIKAAAPDVWDALTNPEKTKIYMYGCETVSDWKKGSPLEWKGIYEGKEMIFVKGKILDIQTNKRLKYTVIDPNATYEDIPENYLNVIYELSEQDGQTILSVTQDGFEKAAEGEKRYMEIYNNGEGWNPILEKIKELVETK